MAKKTSSFILTLRYSLLQGVYWGTFGTLLAFSSLYLADQGLSYTHIGLLLALSNIISAVLQPFIASFTDKATHIDVRGVTLLLTLLTSLSGFVLYYVLTADILFTIVLYLITTSLLFTVQPFINALGFTLNTSSASANFGVARGIGSFSYAIITYTLGTFLTHSNNIDFVVLIHAQLCIILAIVIFFFRASPHITSITPTQQPFRKSNENTDPPLVFIKKNKRFMIVLLGVIFLSTSHNGCLTYLAQITSFLGGSNTDYGIMIALAAALEIPCMVLFTRIMKRFSCGNMLKFSSIFYILKVACYLWALAENNVSILFVGQFAQPFGYALLASASVYYVDISLSANNKMKGHAFMTTAATIGSVVGTSLSGLLLDFFGYGIMLIASMILAAIGSALLFFSINNPKKNAELSII